MKFIIKATYKDGDSFNSYLDRETLDYGWENEKVVIENMIALKEHYEAYRKDNDRFYGSIDFDPKTRWWYSKPTFRGDNIDEGINLKRDDGTLFYYRCPWCGYFASLQDLTMGIKEFKIEL